MKSIKAIAAALCVGIMVSACGSAAGNGALIGTGGGALLGAIAGRLIGGNAQGTAIGGAVGAAVGATAGTLIGKHMDKVKAEAAAKAQAAQVEMIKDANGLDCVKVTFGENGIKFATNSSTLNDAAKAELAKFAGVLKNNTDCDVAIYGHTDSSGNDAINLPLSKKRAESVSTYLNTCGVAAAQVKDVQGLGSSIPAGDNSTAAGKALNRRVEVYLYPSERMIEAANNGTLK